MKQRVGQGPGRHAPTGRHGCRPVKNSGRQGGMDAAGFCGCCNPAHFIILPDGNFVTAEKGLCRVKLYGPQGQFLGFVAGPELFQGPRQTYDGAKPTAFGESVVAGLAADSQGRVLILDPGSGNVRVFEKREKN